MVAVNHTWASRRLFPLTTQPQWERGIQNVLLLPLKEETYYFAVLLFALKLAF